MNTRITLLALAVGTSACLLMAQDAPPRPSAPPRPPREAGPDGAPRANRPVNPIIAALDLNKDGTLDAGEIAKASESLKALDKNGDGSITADEYRPERGGQGGGQGGGGRRPGRPPAE